MTQPADPNQVTPNTLPEVVKAREDVKNQVIFEITRPTDASVLLIYIKAPLLAEVIKKFTPGNYPKGEIAPIYHPILLEIPGAKDRVVTRPGLSKVTKNFVAERDFNWNEPPRTILLANPDALAAGFTLTYKVDAPVPPDAMRKFGKMFCEGCNDIITNARAFKMAWVMEEVHAVPPPAFK